MLALMSNAAPGYYEDGSGTRRWWDGGQWTDHYEPAATAVATSAYAQPPAQEWVQQPQPQQYPQQQYPRMANQMPVSYVRQQKGHSLTLHILLCFVFVGFITIPYYSISPNHYWHF